MPKNDFHWDAGLTHVIKNLIPKELFESCESMFEYDVECGIEEVMNKSGMVYSEELFKVVENNAECVCLACTDRNAFEKLEFKNIGKEKCSSGCFHITIPVNPK